MNDSEKTRRGFGQRVRHYRQLLGWQLDDLAERIGTTRVSMSRIENGKQNLSFDAMVAIARALEVRLSDLVGEGDDPSHESLCLSLIPVMVHCHQALHALQGAITNVSNMETKLHAIAPHH